MRCAQRGGDVGAGAEAGIDKVLVPQFVERGGIKMRALGLNERLAVPIEPEPAQILLDPADELGPAAAGVEILDAKQEAPARRPRPGTSFSKAR